MHIKVSDQLLTLYQFYIIRGRGGLGIIVAPFAGDLNSVAPKAQKVPEG